LHIVAARLEALWFREIVVGPYLFFVVGRLSRCPLQYSEPEYDTNYPKV